MNVSQAGQSFLDYHRMNSKKTRSGTITAVSTSE